MGYPFRKCKGIEIFITLRVISYKTVFFSCQSLSKGLHQNDEIKIGRSTLTKNI